MLIEYLLLDIWPIKSFLHLYNILEPNPSVCEPGGEFQEGQFYAHITQNLLLYLRMLNEEARWTYIDLHYVDYDERIRKSCI